MTLWPTVKERAGEALVLAQFSLIAALAWEAFSTLSINGVPWFTWCTAAAASCLGLWTLKVNPLGNFNIRPNPKRGGRLIEVGPYRWIRHPMYSTVLLYGLAAVASASHSRFAWILFIALCCIINAKAALEEQMMKLSHEGYGAYCHGRQRFIPKVY